MVNLQLLSIFTYHSGLYLLSGGAENVLLISQISSGQRQFLPRLGAELVGLGQTKSGSLYSVSLSNNTIKIINAADLQLVSEISGIHSIASPSKSSSPYTPPLALLQPHREQLYINGHDLSRGTLQGYDIWQDQQTQRIDVARITRTKFTGAEKRLVFEPTISLGSFTNDGTWLATVDEWHNHYTLEELDPTEIYLKFWMWRGKQWEVISRIDSPHGIHCRVLGLASPNTIKSIELEFASLGANGKVKIWRPLKLSAGPLSETTWSLHRTIGSTISTFHSEGALTYSADGSVLVTGIGGDIFVIDVLTGSIIKSLHVANSISKLDILGRFVLYLHNRSSLFSGWDIATGEIIFSQRLDRPYSAIAVNRSLQTFAISNASASSAKSSIVICRILANAKVDEVQISLNSVVSVLLAAEFTGFSGFICVDESGQIVCISPKKAKSVSTSRDGPYSGAALIPRIVDQKTAHIKSSSHRQQCGISVQALQDIVEKNESADIVDMYEAIIQNL